jgi:hypothetical protein
VFVVVLGLNLVIEGRKVSGPALIYDSERIG